MMIRSEAGGGSLTRLLPRLGVWICDALDLGGGDQFSARFRSGAGDEWLEVMVVRGAAGGAAFHRFTHCAVRYRGHLDALTAERRDDVRELVLAVGAMIDARLDGAPPGATIAEALGRSRVARRVVFGRELLWSLLSPDLTGGVPILDGWTLADVFPTSYASIGQGTKLALCLDFRHDASRRLLMTVGERRPGSRTFAETTHFAISYLSPDPDEPPAATTLRALVCFLLKLRDHDRLEVEFPDVTADIARLLPAASPAADAAARPVAKWLNLAIPAECGQRCSFCSVKELLPPSDGGDAFHARLAANLTASRQRGVTGVRWNGYDPLAYSRILDLLGLAARLGYERAEVFSPATRLADRATCDAIVAALPAARRFYVPLYAADADTHDREVGRPGAFGLVMQALEHLTARVGSEAITILSVATLGSLAALPALMDFCAQRGLQFSAHMPYPSLESRADRFFSAVPRQADVAEVFARRQAASGAVGPFPVASVAPCVVLRAMRASGVPVKRWLFLEDAPPRIVGTEYRDVERFEHVADSDAGVASAAVTIPCPHAATCVVRRACPGELLRSYVERYGSDEFTPVLLPELLAAI